MTSGTTDAGNATAVPGGVAGLTPQWLTDVLRTDAGLPRTAAVTDVRAERIAEDSGFSSLLYRLHLTGDDVPATLIAKLAAESEARGAMELLEGYRRELRFYRDVAGRAPMDTPRVYAARIAEDSVDFVLLLEDLRDWDNADHLAGLSMDRARLAIANLAALHAWSTDPVNCSALQSFPSLSTAVVRELLVPAFGPGWQVYREKSGAAVPRRVARFAERFAESAPQALSALTEHSMLLHGDIRADNMFFDGDRLKIVDFQFASVGCGAADIGYLVSQGLPTALRRGHDQSLVREYLGALRQRGLTSYHFDDAWRHYRFAVAYLMMLPVITLIGWDSMPERSRALCLELTARSVAAIDDIDATEVFG
ncbi:phosphotransferase [Mycobacterium sp. ITM-2016-00317]|uniref:phosphotransferase n=1 Tax=Mycobacterium sp. ITM-2016-00317 TaxID=2099694 RepID=UPI00287FAF1C|nr:phosphotransferase [Mycobacterium sp. ITM-2016-00317]WNG89355.1 phosphotransferase [Mycobacterium sp. ITM-2016-00317]